MAGWADKYKQERIFVQRTDEHNKYWIAYYDEATKNAVIRWGRIGTKGQSQTKSYPSEYSAASFIDGKEREKARKGYRSITKTEYDRLSVEAAIVGAQNKCHDFKWVEIAPDMSFKTIPVERLQSPDCNPGIYVDLETKKSFGGKNSFSLLLTFDSAYIIGKNHGGTQIDLTKITKTHYLYELTEKVEEAIGRSLTA